MQRRKVGATSVVPSVFDSETDQIRLSNMAGQLRQIRAAHVMKKANDDPLYHALSHAITDISRAHELMGQTIVHLPEPESYWHDGIVTIGRVKYPAQINIQRWNGWAAPRFTREVAEQVAIDAARDGDYSDWGWEDDVLVIVSENNPHIDDVRLVYAPDQDGLYHVGSWEWTWEELEPADD